MASNVVACDFGPQVSPVQRGVDRLAQLAVVTKQTVSRLELGTVHPSWESGQALARGLGVAVGAFVVAAQHPEAPPDLPRGRPRKQQGEGEKPAAKKPKKGAK
jgi:transcriptional regulator with XRE-family HTH domain